ncbi:hypothetical protein GCM10009830_08120 [Glycomyces endophyticus]|uniref:Response regulatory domain-containing protein n=1 Tax=Glycomyces endophyticus TaxID=480996 RepID=A0ABN2G3Y2_9ACTN
MSEAIWIELIKILPAFLWIGFGFIALAVAKRIFSQQAPRMTKVETPWVTVELAQQAIEAATVRGAEPALEPPPPWQIPAPFPAPVGPAPELRPAPFDNPFTGTAERRPAGPYGDAPGGLVPVGDAAGSPPADEDAEDPPFQTEPARLRPPNTPPADEPADGAGANANGDQPAGPLTEPRQGTPEIPPYQFAPPPTTTYYAPPPGGRGAYASVPPLPYQQAAYSAADAQRGRRAATRLALAADLLNGGAILWVDDHPEWNAPLVRLFRTAGITVDSAASTDEAMRALDNRSYDLVITDMGRQADPGGEHAGVDLLDRMVAAGVPTPAAVFTSLQAARTTVHPRAAVATNSPEELVDTVVDLVGTRRSRLAPSGGSSWIDRLRGR